MALAFGSAALPMTRGVAFADTAKEKTTDENEKPVMSGQVTIEESKLDELPETVTSFGAAVLNEVLYVYGGHTGSAHSYSKDDQSGSFWALDLRSGESAKWRKLTGGPKLQGLALVAAKGRLIRLGGFTAMNEDGEDQDLQSQTSVASYDPKTKEWSDLPPLPESRSSFDAAVLDDTVYVFGGWALGGEDSESQWHETAWSLKLSQANAKWVPLAKPNFKRRAVSVAAHAGKLYVVGGMQSENGPTTKVAIYDPIKDSWTSGPSLPGKGMSGFGSSSFATGGKLYVSSMDGGVHRLNPSGDHWETLAKMEPSRFFHRMVPWGDDQLLMIGGANMEVGKFTNIEVIRVLPTSTAQ